jgi:hypothetical protein
MSQFKRPNDILAASSGFDPPSMIALASGPSFELGLRIMEGLLTIQQSVSF